MREGEGGIRDKGYRASRYAGSRIYTRFARTTELGAHAYIRAARAPQNLRAHAYIRAARAPQDLRLTHIYALCAHHRAWGSRIYTRCARTTGLGAHAHIRASRAPQDLGLAPEAEDLRPRYCFVRQGEARSGGI